jgi:hypothetical protein
MNIAVSTHDSDSDVMRRKPRSEAVSGEFAPRRWAGLERARADEGGTPAALSVIRRGAGERTPMTAPQGESP